jgi:hypothetical protein
MPGTLALIGRIRQNIKAGWNVIKNPGPLWEALRKAIEPMVMKIQPAIRARVSSMYTERELYIQVSVLHYLSQSLSELGANWWPQLKKMGGDLLWPWDEVGKEFMPMLEDFGNAVGAVFDLEFNRAADLFLSGMKKFNGIAGALSGWFMLASVLIGAALGSLGFITGPGGFATVGAGASAGLAFAEEVGMGLIVIALATEAAVIEKSSFEISARTASSNAVESQSNVMFSSTNVTCFAPLNSVVSERMTPAKDATGPSRVSVTVIFEIDVLRITIWNSWAPIATVPMRAVGNWKPAKLVTILQKTIVSSKPSSVER